MLTVSRYDKQSDGRWDKASEITTRLNDKGYTVSVRTVQRDLQELSNVFDIEVNDKNPRDYGWRWKKGADLNIPGMSVSEALAMRLVETHMKQLLPASMLDGLQGVFNQAQAKLDKVEAINRNHTKDWLKKVRVVAPSQPMLPPSVDQAAQAGIYQALLESKQIKASYQPVGNNQTKEYIMHPLGLIMRGAVSYLVASLWDYTNVQLYALHRFSMVDILKDAVKVPEGFSRNSNSIGRMPSASGRPNAPLSANCAFLSAIKSTRSFMRKNQLKIPEANNTPRSGSPFFHCCNAGCRSPDTMSVAPFASFAKHSTSRGSSMFNATGLCVARST